MRFRSLVLFVLIGCYLVSSSSLVHAGAMRMVTMPISSDTCGCEHQQPTSHDGHTERVPSHDCFELCMGVYANLGGAADVKISSFSLLQQYIVSVAPVPVAKDDISQISQSVDDPPDLVGFGYAIIGDEVKKLE